MNLTATFKSLLKRKIATAVLVTASLAAFATLGDESGKKAKPFAEKSANSKNFSLRPTYSYRGNNLLTTRTSRYIVLNTNVTYQKGNATYVVPLKKKVLLDKVKFNPSQSKF